MAKIYAKESEVASEQYEGMKEIEGKEFFEHYTLEATSGQALLRIDKYLANLLPFITRSRLKNIADFGYIMVNDKPVRPSYKVKPFDKVKVMLPFPPPMELLAEDIPLDIRYEDDEIIVLHKPAGMVVHPGLGHRSGTLVHGLLWHVKNTELPNNGGDETRPGLVHRLDKDTSGIMVVAKTERSLAHLSQQFADRTSDRRYHAIVWGNLKDDEGTIEGNIDRSQKDRKIFQVYPTANRGKHAVTHYKVLERYGMATLVELKLETGRTHQIRVHMKHFGHTLIGDANYGGNKIMAGPPTRKFKQFIHNCLEIMPRQALHAKTLAFTHPKTEEWMSFESDWPEDFRQLRDKMYGWAQTYV